MSELFNRLLERRTSSDGGRPLITYYEEPGGIRTELSATSFSNWVNKTAGLLTDEILVDPGQTVRLDLLRTAPAHWVTLVWVAATWRVGCAVTLTSDADGAVEVVGPDGAQDDPGSVERVACSLHPFGLGFREALPTGTIDYGVEVRAQPDSFTGRWPSPTAPAWIDGSGTRTQQEVVGSISDASARRTLVDPADSSDIWRTVLDCLIAPVVTGGSAVVAVGADAERRAQIAEAERVE